MLGLKYGGRVFRQGGHSARCAGVEQHFGVFVLRIGEDFGCFAGFEDTAVTHNGDIVGKTAHKVQVVRNVEHGHAVFFLQA